MSTVQTAGDQRRSPHVLRRLAAILDEKAEEWAEKAEYIPPDLKSKRNLLGDVAIVTRDEMDSYVANARQMAREMRLEATFLENNGL